MAARTFRHSRTQYIEWLRVTRDLSPHTIRAYDGDVAALERCLGDQVSVRRLDARHLFAFVEAQRGAGVGARSIRRRVSGIRGFCRWLADSGFIRSDPCVGFVASIGRPHKLPRAVSSRDLDRLLTALRSAADIKGTALKAQALARPHEATTLLAVVLMVATGLRVGEVVGIRHRDLDLPGRTLRVSGKGAHERQVFITNDWVSTLVTAYLITRSDLRVNHAFLLFNCQGAPLDPSVVRRRINEAARKAGLQSRITPHMLRHTAATQLLEAGVDIRYIQRLLGHASLTTTELYTHVSDTALKRAVSEADVIGRSLSRDK